MSGTLLNYNYNLLELSWASLRVVRVNWGRVQHRNTITETGVNTCGI